MLKLVSSIALTLSLVQSVSAAPLCQSLYARETQSAAVKKLVREDAYMQWLRWEQKANFEPFHKSPIPLVLQGAHLPVSELNVNIESYAPAAIKNFIYRDNGTKVLWIKHPYNTEKETPYRNEPTVEKIPAQRTASRSIAPETMLRGFTVKAPNDHPHGPKGQYQKGKANTADDVRSALLHSDHILKRDKALGEDPVLVILLEIATVSQKGTDTGYVIRDVRKLDDGNYYLPALSIPYVGREIADINGMAFEAFWNKNYAQLLGQAKARMLLRYGLQMETPNSQNMLIQLDRNLRPTGKIVFRDVSDAFYVKGITDTLGFDKAIEKDIEAGYNPVNVLQPYISNSLWRFNEAGEKSVANEDLRAWSFAHNRAYARYILTELGVKNTELMMADKADDRMTNLYQFLLSEEGQQALKNYKAKQRSQRKAS